MKTLLMKQIRLSELIIIVIYVLYNIVLNFYLC